MFQHRFMLLLIDKIMFWKKNKVKAVKRKSPQPIDGHEAYREALPVINISFIFCDLEDLFSSTKIQLIAEELNVNSAIVIEDLKRTLQGTIEDVRCCIEYPYVEEYYRDTYYGFYSRKHKEYNRNCFRISFFKPTVTEDNFFKVDMNNNYLGYMVLRPTPKHIIGYTFLSPRIYRNNTFSICLCKRTILVMGRMLETTGFPFCSQDGEMNQCAENAIVILFDYFSRRYNKYSRVLPSEIAIEVSNNLSNRNQPSIGLDMDTVARVMEAMGMATRRYIKAKEGETDIQNHVYNSTEFYKLMQIYVESGLPIYACTDTHAFLIVGRENKFFSKGARVVCMNDNEQPYSLRDSLEDLEEFIVPIAENILLDAEQLNPKETLKALNNSFPDLDLLVDGQNYYHRIFLTTSRSYKSYLAKSALSNENKLLAICTAMPRYIWVCESFNEHDILDDINLNHIDLITVLDATDYAYGCNHLLMVKSKEKLVIPTTDKTRLQRKTYSILDSKESMRPFMRNLKGQHTSWQG